MDDDIMKHMRAFRRSYVASAALLVILAGAGVASGLMMGKLEVLFSMMLVAAAVVALLPVFRKGGIEGNHRLAIRIAAVFTLLSGVMVVWNFYCFVRTGGGEGPNGEGSPLANIIAMAFGAAVTLCPWLLTVLRRLRVR